MDSVVRDGSKEIDATVTVADSAKAFSFWRAELGKHGYRVGEADGGFGAYEIRFSGHGCVGNSQVAITQNQAAVECNRT